MASTSTRWPEGLTPAEASLVAHNELTTNVPPEAIWPHLVAATRWRELYPNCWGLKIEGGASELSMGTRFTWWTFGARVATVVDAFEPPHYLAWTGGGLGARGHHAWILEPTDDGGCHFVTEETQRGAAIRWLAPVLRPAMRHFHQRWLEGLVTAAGGRI